MKQFSKAMLRAMLLMSMPACLIAADNQVTSSNRFQLAAGGAGGPAAVFKLDQHTGKIWYAWWDPNEGRYQWREIEADAKAPKPVEANQNPK